MEVGVSNPQTIYFLLKVSILVEDLIELIFKRLNFLSEVVVAMESVFLALEFEL